MNRKQLFENAPVGKNLIDNLTKRLCKAAGQPEHWTNHCLRATGISTLKRLGYDDRAICDLTGMCPVLNLKLEIFIISEFFHQRPIRFQ